MSTSVPLFSLSFFFFSLSSSSVFLRLLSFLFFCPLSLKVFQEYRGRERERAIQKMYRAKNKLNSQTNTKKKKTQLREKNEQWNDRRSVFRYSDRNRFLWKGLSFTCPTCNLISVSERCAIRCYFEQGHYPSELSCK